MKLSARVLSILFPVLIFFLLVLVPKGTVFASELPSIPANPYLTPNVEAGVAQDQHTYTQSIFINTLSTAICFLAGVDPMSSNHKCLGFDPKSGKLGYAKEGGGAIAAVGGLISYTFIPPASSIDYGKYLAGHFGITEKAYAVDTDPCAGADRGYGFCSLQPLVNAWIAMRDIVYLLLVVIFVVIGVAIMLRVHIDPRTVMTIENQIPKIIVVIFLVTFSLALAGFLIDIMYLSIFVIGKVLVQIHTVGNQVALISSTNPLNPNNTNPTAVYNSMVTAPAPWTALGSLSALGGQGGFLGISGAVAVSFIGIISPGYTAPPGLLEFVFGSNGSNIILNIGWLILLVIVLIALLYAMIRIWMTLLIAYITIILDVIFAPFWFLAGLIPGASVGIGGWFKDILANLAVFPAVIAMFSLGLIFKNIATGSDGKLFSPPMLGGQDAEFFGGLILFGFIFSTPHILQTIKKAIKAPSLDLGPVMEPLAAAGNTVRGGAKSTAVTFIDPLKQGKGAGRGRFIRSILGA